MGIVDSPQLLIPGLLCLPSGFCGGDPVRKGLDALTVGRTVSCAQQHRTLHHVWDAEETHF